MRTHLRWGLWGLLLLLFTGVLISPQAPRAVRAAVPTEAAFWVSKSAHVGGYGFLSALVAWLPVPSAGRWRIRLMLVAHGAATECIQHFVPGRMGAVLDVGLDTLGVLLGGITTWLLRVGCPGSRSADSPAAPAE